MLKEFAEGTWVVTDLKRNISREFTSEAEATAFISELLDFAVGSLAGPMAGGLSGYDMIVAGRREYEAHYIDIHFYEAKQDEESGR